MRSYWDNLYNSISADIGETGSIILGFNTNIDALIHIEQKHLDKYIKSDQQALNILQKIENPPGDIHTLNDLFAGILWCFSRGKAAEWLIYNESVDEWIHENLCFEEQRIGGQAGIMTNLLATLGIQVIVHVCNLSKNQANLFHQKNVFVPHIENGETILVQPQQAWKENISDLVHWIIEFQKGEKLQLGDKIFECPRDNRFIASFDIPNSSLEINPEFLEGIKSILPRTQACILAGFHLLQPEIQGSTYQVRIHFLENLLKSWLKINKNLKIHFEFAYMNDLTIRKAVINHLICQGYSLGVNEVELSQIGEVITKKKLIEGKWQDLFELYHIAVEIFHNLRIHRLHVRTLENNLMIISKEYPLDAQIVRNALLFGATLGAAKAKLGKIISQKAIEIGKAVNVSEVGLENLRKFTTTLEKHSLIKDARTLIQTGIWKQEDHTLIVTPTKVVKYPVSTVGLGDTISASTFLWEIAASQIKNQ